MENINQIYIINPNYILKNDQYRVYLTYRYNPNMKIANDVDIQFFSYIHPEQAKIFALFDGERTMSEVIDIIAEKLNISRDRASELIEPYIENKKRLRVTFQNNNFAFPTYFLIPKKRDVEIYSYDQNSFDCSELDFINPRINLFPIDITLMVNTICKVDCIYCYADCRKKTDCQVPIETLDRLISDCRKNNVRSFNLMGGEVLLYKNWEWLVKKLMEYDYTPYISTKIPVEKNTVQIIYDLGIRLFQISLDSFDGNILEKNLNIPNGNKYIEKMEKTLKYFEELNIKLNIHAVITKNNNDISHLQQYLNRLSTFGNILNVQISIVGESLYKKGYSEHKLSREEVMKISDFINSARQKKIYPFTISISTGELKETFIGNKNGKKRMYEKRGLCSANVMQAFILPTGDVTICEELMFNPQFILGNLKNDDLATIWKNNKLKSLGSADLYEFSPCGKCKEFASCRGIEAKKGVCWKQVLHAYGENNWNYPDPKCPYAPKKMNPFYIE